MWARPELVSAWPWWGFEASVWTFEADKVKCIPGALNLFHPAHKACEAGRVFSLTETPRGWCSNMSGNHYKGHEVSCCIKYFIFGFNILFWVRAMVLFVYCTRLRLSPVHFGHYRVHWPIGTKARVIITSYRGSVIFQVHIQRHWTWLQSVILLVFEQKGWDKSSCSSVHNRELIGF